MKPKIYHFGSPTEPSGIFWNDSSSFTVIWLVKEGVVRTLHHDSLTEGAFEKARRVFRYVRDATQEEIDFLKAQSILNEIDKD